VGHLFSVANALSRAIFEVVKADGTNILVSNGLVAGQHFPHVSIHIIPRFKNDNVTFSWKNVKISEKEMEDLALSLRNTLKGTQKKRIDSIIDSSFSETRRIP